MLAIFLHFLNELIINRWITRNKVIASWICMTPVIIFHFSLESHPKIRRTDLQIIGIIVCKPEETYNLLSSTMCMTEKPLEVVVIKGKLQECTKYM